MKLKPNQERQIRRQMEAYEMQKRTELVRIPFGVNDLELQIDPFVANPNIMNSGPQVVQYLQEYPHLVKGKVVTDMGTGSGILGIAAAKLGARKVFMMDIDQRAVDNAKRNVNANNMEGVCDVFQSDLFDNCGPREKSQVQIFNHPYFAEEPIKGKDWTRMMLGGTELISEYLEQAPKYSVDDAFYIFSWLALAGNENAKDNDPAKRAPEHGYKVVNVVEQAPVNLGIPQAPFKIFLLGR